MSYILTPAYFTVTLKKMVVGFFASTELLTGQHTQTNVTKTSLNTMTALFVPGRYNTGSREQHWNALKRSGMAIWNCLMVISHTYLILNEGIKLKRVISECHHHGSPPQDICVLCRTFIGRDKTWSLHKIW